MPTLVQSPEPTKSLLHPPPLGFPLPPHRHAVSVQLPAWQDMRGMVAQEPCVASVQQIGYPKSFLNQGVAQVHEACVALLGQPGDAAAAASRRFYLVFFPAQFNSSAMIFWQISGTGISSHLAESMHECLDSISPAPVLDQVEESELFRELANAETNEILCTRISNLLKRASISLIKAPASPSNFFLYPTGMAVIYELNMLLQIWRPEQNIVFCFPYKQAHLETARDVRQGSQIL